MSAKNPMSNMMMNERSKSREGDGIELLSSGRQARDYLEVAEHEDATNKRSRSEHGWRRKVGVAALVAGWALGGAGVLVGVSARAAAQRARKESRAATRVAEEAGVLARRALDESKTPAAQSEERRPCGVSESVLLDASRLDSLEWEVLADLTAWEVVLAIPTSRLNRPFTVIATSGKVSSSSSSSSQFLHYDADDGAESFFVMEAGARRGEVVVTQPDLSVRLAPNDDSYAEALKEGYDSSLSWTRALPAKLCVLENSAYIDNATTVDWSGPWPPQEEDVMLLDVREWLLDGLGVLSLEEQCASRDDLRITSAKAFKHNLKFVTTCNRLLDGEEAVEIHYSLALLPEAPMPRRRADDRVGYFGGTYLQIGPLNNAALEIDGPSGEPRVAADSDQRVNFIHRWRLEKDCEGLCAPLKPITYHIDPTVPRELWALVSRGILLWNAAFEEIGFKEAVRVVLPTDDDWPVDYDAGDVRYSSLSWVPDPQLGLAIGPSHVDARTGEIIYANVIVGEGWIRAFTGSWLDEATLGIKEHDHHHHHHHHHHGSKACSFDARAHLARGAAQLLARGSWDGSQGGLPAGFVGAGLTDVVSHEIGHTLGLRHNFKASALYSEAEIHAESKTSRVVASSVMDYISPVVAEDPDEQGAYFMEQVGVYDKWAIRYGYSTNETLRSIADEAQGNRVLARADDLDEAYANDPLARKYDMTSDATEWCGGSQRRLTLRLLSQMETLTASPDFVFSRQAEALYSLGHRAIRLYASDCARLMPDYLSGVAYDRTNRDQLSSELSSATRDRALSLIASFLFDQNDLMLLLPSRKAMSRAATYADVEYKWGLHTLYEEWLSQAQTLRVALAGDLTDLSFLQKVDANAFVFGDQSESAAAALLSRLTMMMPVMVAADDETVRRSLYTSSTAMLQSTTDMAWLESLVLLRQRTVSTVGAASPAFSQLALHVGLNDLLEVAVDRLAMLILKAGDDGLAFNATMPGKLAFSMFRMLLATDSNTLY